MEPAAFASGATCREASPVGDALGYAGLWFYDQSYKVCYLWPRTLYTVDRMGGSVAAEALKGAGCMAQTIARRAGPEFGDERYAALFVRGDATPPRDGEEGQPCQGPATAR